MWTGARDVMATLRRMALAVAVVLHLGLVGVARGQSYSREFFPRPPRRLRDDLRLELLLGRALKEGAVCLDGSPSGFWFRPGTGAGANNWIVFLEGGGWCYDEEACLYRSGTMLGTSTQWPATRPVDRPLFSADPRVNPDFHDWNIVNVGYCDGASFSGDRDEPVIVDQRKLYFRGSRILHQLFRHLVETKGMGRAANVLLSGCSAGGLATIVHADQVSKYFGSGTVFKAVPFSGFFPDTDNFQGVQWFQGKQDYVFSMQNITTNLNPTCLANNVGKEHLCFDTQVSYKYLQTPTFLVNSVYDIWTVGNIYNIKLESLLNFDLSRVIFDLSRVIPFLNDKAKLVHDLITRTPTYQRHGAYLHTCYTHCGAGSPEGWAKVRVNGTTVRDAVGDFFFQRNDFTSPTPCEYSNLPPFQCNPTCPV